MIDEKIFALLLAEVEKTRQEYLDAKERFWRAAGEARQLPRTPGSRRDAGEPIRQAVAEENSARRAHLDAMIRLNRYLTEGTVPDDEANKAGMHTKAAGG